MPRLTKPLVLVGPMGVGKTTIGKKLAKALDLEFLDTDAMIVARHGAIAEIFANLGEAKFREFEVEAVSQALEKVAVIATGGGAPISETNRTVLGQKAVVCYLSTDGRHMSSRLSGGGRPLITDGLDSWRKIYAERKHSYESIANFEVDTSNKPLAVIVQEIKIQLGINE